MGFRHPHVAALLGHLLATLALGRCHRRTANTHAATGSAASISARAETPTLISSFTITSLSFSSQ
jgi:hypothetical protein